MQTDNKQRRNSSIHITLASCTPVSKYLRRNLGAGAIDLAAVERLETGSGNPPFQYVCAIMATTGQQGMVSTSFDWVLLADFKNLERELCALDRF